MRKRSVKYWGRACLESMGACMGISLALLIFCAAWALEIPRGAFTLYPYYLMLMGAFYLAVGIPTYFRSYLPVLVSMNATRSRAILGLLFHGAAMILGLIALSAVIWLTPLGNVPGAADGLPVMAGVLFLIGAIGMLLGAVSARWGKIGTILAGIMCAAVGGICGAAVGILGEEEALQILEVMLEFRFLWLLALGLAAYLLAGVFALVVNRNMEVRM